jgi:hypothetical protein
VSAFFCQFLPFFVWSTRNLPRENGSDEKENQTEKDMKRQNPAGSAIQLPHALYLDLLRHLMQSGDPRSLQEVAVEALTTWLHDQHAHPRGHGYQWRDVFLPEGSELLFRHHGQPFIAKVEGGQLRFRGQSVTPHGWLCELTGTQRNPWRDLLVRRSWRDAWTRVAEWRGRPASGEAMENPPDHRNAAIRQAREVQVLLDVLEAGKQALAQHSINAGALADARRS